MQSGYIKLFRAIKDSDDWPKCRPFTEFEAWIDILLMARWSKKQYSGFDKGGIYVLNLGDFLASERFLAARWEWGKKKARGYVARLEKKGQILVQERNHQRTILHVCNYELYQDNKQDNGTTKGTTVEPRWNHGGTTVEPKNKKGKKEKKGKKGKKDTPKGGGVENDLFEMLFAQVWEDYPRKSSKTTAKTAFKKHFKKYKTKDKQEEFTLLLRAKIKEFSNSWDWKKDGGQFIPYLATWLNQERFLEKAGPQQSQDKPKGAGGNMDLIRRRHEERQKNLNTNMDILK